jgi:hypothetical protein
MAGRPKGKNGSYACYQGKKHGGINTEGTLRAFAITKGWEAKNLT